MLAAAPLLVLVLVLLAVAVAAATSRLPLISHQARRRQEGARLN